MTKKKNVWSFSNFKKKKNQSNYDHHWLLLLLSQDTSNDDGDGETPLTIDSFFKLRLLNDMMNNNKHIINEWTPSIEKKPKKILIIWKY